MDIIAMYVERREDLVGFKHALEEAGQDPIIRITPRNAFRLPAVRTERNLYQGRRLVAQCIRMIAKNSGRARASGKGDRPR